MLNTKLKPEVRYPFRTAILILIFLFFTELKAQDINTVFQNISNSFGSQKKTPKLEIINNDKLVAQFVNGIEPKVQISKKTIALCRNLKKDSSNALASIFAHELAHYYKNHTECTKYFAGNKSLLNSTSVNNEAEADRIGLVQSLLSGYASTKIYNTMLEKIYSDFNLDKNLKGYLPLDKRQAQTQAVINEAEDNYRIFTAANFLIVTDNTLPAESVYDYLSSKYESREIFNNAGVARILSVMDLMVKNDPEKMPFILPVETDAFTRLNFSIERSSESNDYTAICIQKLKDARDKFTKAIQLDKKYTLAYINLACSNILLDNPDAALGNIKDMELQGLKSKEAYTIKAIANHYLKNDKTALQNFETAKKYNAANSDYNLQLMKSKSGFFNFLPDFSAFLSKYFTGSKAAVSTPVNIAGESKMFGLSEINQKVYEHNIQISTAPYIEISYTETKKYDAIKINLANKIYYLLKTTPYTDFTTAKGFKIGQTKDQLEKYYKEPESVINAGSFSYLLYQGLLFTENYKSSICDWLIFKEIKKTAN